MKRFILMLLLVSIADFAGSQDLQKVYDATSPSIVSIRSVDLLGYGFFVDKDLVVTNYQVINKARMGAAKAIFINDSSINVIGYVAANEALNMVILKVDYECTSPLILSRQPGLPGEKLFVYHQIDKQIQLLEGNLVEMKDYGANKMLQLTTSHILDQSGFPVVDAEGYVLGITVPSPLKDSSKNFAIASELIYQLLQSKTEMVEEIKTLNPPAQIETNLVPKSEMLNQLINQGNGRMQAKDYRAAEEKFSAAVKIAPGDPDAYVFRGQARINLMKYKDALDDFNRALDIEPNFAEAYDLRGIARAELGDKTGACEDWKKSYELGFNEAFKLIKEFCEMDDE